MSVSIREPRVILDVAGKKITFLTDTGATYPVLISHAGPLSSKSCPVTAVDGKSLIHYLTGLLPGQSVVSDVTCLSGCPSVY